MARSITTGRRRRSARRWTGPSGNRPPDAPRRVRPEGRRMPRRASVETDGPGSEGPPATDEQDSDARAEENRRYRRLQTIVALASASLTQDPDLTPEQGVEVILWARAQACALFPGKEETFDLIYRPRLVRILEERFGSAPPAAGSGDSGVRS